MAAETLESEGFLGPNSRDRDARMRGIIEAAVPLFAEEGYSEVSTRRIAERAGCSETLLFRYFGGKRGLLTAISRELLNRTWDSNLLIPEDEESLSNYLEQYLLFGFDVMKTSAPSLKVIVSALVTEPELAADFERRHDKEVQDLVQHLRFFQERGNIAAHFDLLAIATGLEQMQFSVGFLLQVIYERSSEELAAVAKNFAAIMSQGLQGEVPFVSLSDSVRRDTIDAARDAEQALQRVIASLKGVQGSDDEIQGADNAPHSSSDGK